VLYLAHEVHFLGGFTKTTDCYYCTIIRKDSPTFFLSSVLLSILRRLLDLGLSVLASGSSRKLSRDLHWHSLCNKFIHMFIHVSMHLLNSFNYSFICVLLLYCRYFYTYVISHSLNYSIVNLFYAILDPHHLLLCCHIQ
jgi:hypothetical protein